MKDITKVDKTDTNKKTFLDMYSREEVNGNVTLACEATGISRQTFYEWLEKDAEFNSAIEESKAQLRDKMESVLVNKAGSGSTPELIFWLKKKHPEYKDTPVQINTQINNYSEKTNEQKDKYGI